MYPFSKKETNHREGNQNYNYLIYILVFQGIEGNLGTRFDSTDY